MSVPTHGELASLRDAVNQLRGAARKTDELVSQLEREVAALKQERASFKAQAKAEPPKKS